jgi:hypothetical protein
MAFDLRQTDLGTCEESLDCVLRAGVECCENCSAQPLDFVAINKNADETALLCGDTPVDCDACVPIWPAGITPLCVNGSCEVVRDAL